MIDQVGTNTGCVSQNADTVSLKLPTWPNAGTHQDGWRGDRTSGEGDSFSVNLLHLTTYFNLDPLKSTKSWVVCNLRGQAGSLMPLGRPRMSVGDVAIVEKWLGCGAPPAPPPPPGEGDDGAGEGGAGGDGAGGAGASAGDGGSGQGGAP